MVLFLGLWGGDHAVTVLCSNHELWQNFTAYKTRFSMPNHDNFENMRHSYTVGTVHFLNMNTETWIDTADIDAAQQQWIATDLAGAALSFVVSCPRCCGSSRTSRCVVVSNISGVMDCSRLLEAIAGDESPL